MKTVKSNVSAKSNTSARSSAKPTIVMGQKTIKGEWVAIEKEGTQLFLRVYQPLKRTPEIDLKKGSAHAAELAYKKYVHDSGTQLGSNKPLNPKHHTTKVYTIANVDAAKKAAASGQYNVIVIGEEAQAMVAKKTGKKTLAKIATPAKKTGKLARVGGKVVVTTKKVAKGVKAVKKNTKKVTTKVKA